MQLRLGPACSALKGHPESDHFFPLQQLLPGPDRRSADQACPQSPSSCLLSLFPNRSQKNPLLSSCLKSLLHSKSITIHHVSALTQKEAQTLSVVPLMGGLPAPLFSRLQRNKQAHLRAFVLLRLKPAKLFIYLIWNVTSHSFDWPPSTSRPVYAPSLLCFSPGHFL